MDVKTETLKSFKWTALNSFGNRVVSFLLGIILARLLSPQDFGVVGMTAIFFALASIMVDSGLSTALVRKKNMTIEDSSTIFFFNIIVSSFCFIVLFFASPYIADFFHTPILVNIVRVSALSMVIGAFGSVHWTLMSKNVNFKTPALVSFPVNITSGIIGVILAYMGFGPWALVLQSLSATTINAVVVWFISPWRPKFIFSMKSFREMFGFSSNLVVNAIVDKFYNEGVGMVIGKFYSPAQLGYYSKGQGTAQLPSTFLYSTVGSILFPILSKIQDDDEKLLHVYSRYMRILSMVIFFGMILMTAVSRPLTIFLYSDRWIPAIIFMQIFCLRYMLWHIHKINWDLLLVRGRSDWAFKKEVVNKIFNFSCLFAAISFGPIAICFAGFVASLLNIVVNTYVAGKLFNFGFRKQFADFFPYIIYSAICCAPAWIISYLDWTPILMLIVQVPLSCALYFGLLYFNKDQEFFELLKLLPVKKYFKKN